MDPVTHAASGAVAMLCFSARPLTRWSLPLAALACAAPDVDIFFSSSPLGFLEFHRGITHALVASPFLGALLALCCFPLWRERTPGHWTFSQVWLFCIAMIFLHDWLDVVTSYGTMLFLPFSHYRVRLNGIFILDLLVTVPLLLVIWRFRLRRAVVLAVFAWIFLYPGLGIVLNQWHSYQWQQRLSTSADADANSVLVYPDAFAPFFWRVIYASKPESAKHTSSIEFLQPLTAAVLGEKENHATPHRNIFAQSINFLGDARSSASAHLAADPKLVEQIRLFSTSGEAFFAFSQLPVMQPAPRDYCPPNAHPDHQFWLFYDLRFGSGLDFVRDLMASRPHADVPFVLMAEFYSTNPNLLELQRIRLRFADSGRDSQWHRPYPPTNPAFAQWLVGKY